MANRNDELKKIEAQLQQQRDEAERELSDLEQQVRESGETLESAEGADNHPGDDSDRLAEQERLLTIRSELSARKDDIDLAIQKVAEGGFGQCERCGDDIPTGRLEVLPFARYCVECQEIVDQEGTLAR
jgi:DnaK suppressor protein